MKQIIDVLPDIFTKSLSRTYEELKLYIKKYYVYFLKEFIAYLWGIETSPRELSEEVTIPFIAYLWGIETILEKFNFKNTESLSRTYEELKRM